MSKTRISHKEFMQGTAQPTADVSEYAALGPQFENVPGLTSAELRNVWKIGINATYSRIRALVASGKLQVARKKTLGTDGRTQMVPVYEIVKEAR